MTVIEKAYAKINYYLEISGRRADGYHELETVMQTVSLADTLTVTRVAGEGITLETGAALPADDKNLVVRAANAYFAASGAPFGCHAVLEKRIPIEAGLGGGSADAAAMLRALNRLDKGRFSAAELAEIAVKIGADVPFLIVGGTALCRGVGEVMTPIESTLHAPIVVAKMGEGVSTPAAFGALDSHFDNFIDFRSDHTPVPLLAGLQAGDGEAVAASIFNRFEAVVADARPAVGALLDFLCRAGALAAAMSGSGPSVFGIFRDAAAAEAATAALSAMGADAFACTPTEAISL
ncbi:MAG: 4-(cytidine 5'-diphospho)-2-C-methyl-D-erythritol kinase [Clostridia bacterium]|nr:4-(cytidine 5'-diphospho)-2-C-methyl-D-erythritol kinase [Clostridia bacterium]